MNISATPSETIIRDVFNGKEEQVIGNIGLIDYGARFYDPDLSRWTTPDPLAEKYYSYSPYSFCNNNPVNFVDLDGRSWYYNSHTGHFVAHIDDDDDYIYLISPDEICRTNGDNHTLSSYRRDDNIFGQLVLEGFLDESIVNNVISDLFDRANVDENGTSYISIDMPILANSEINAYAEIKLTNQTIKTIEINPTYVYKGYDSMLIFAHEIGHLVEINNNTISNNVNAREISADKFARGHWVYKKASNHIKEILHQHENQHH